VGHITTVVDSNVTGPILRNYAHSNSTSKPPW